MGSGLYTTRKYASPISGFQQTGYAILNRTEKFEADLWKIADDLRANSNLASNEYFMPIRGLIFLRHATKRFYEGTAAVEANKAAGKMPNRPLVEPGLHEAPCAKTARKRAVRCDSENAE